jgi:phage terminase large subunit-like protein
MADLTARDLEYWRDNPDRFVEQCLVNPETNEPFVLLPCERSFIRLAFTTDADGRLVYTEWLYGAPKKTGKTGFAAMIELTAITLFGGRYGEGYCCANDLDQATGRVFEAVKRIVLASPIFAGMTRITADKIIFEDTGSFIVALSSDAASAAGGAPTISVFDELWGYTSERARRYWDEMIPTPTKQISARLTVSYAGFVGESKLLEDLYKRGMDLPELGPDLRGGDGMLFFWTHTAQAPWQTDAWVADSRRQLRPAQFLRMIENRWTASEESFINIAEWDACVSPELMPQLFNRSLSCFGGVDASVKHDSCALALCTWSQPYQRVELVAHRIFQPTPEHPIDFEAEVEATLLEWKRNFNVRQILYDPYQMASSAQRMVREGVPMVEFPQTVPNLTEASSNLYQKIKYRNLAVYPDEAIRLAVSRAVAIESNRGWRIGKDKQTHRIDIVIALAQAALIATKTGILAYDESYRAFQDDAVDEPDGPTKWRLERLGREGIGPLAPGAVRLGDGGYRAPRRWG